MLQAQNGSTLILQCFYLSFSINLALAELFAHLLL